MASTAGILVVGLTLGFAMGALVSMFFPEAWTRPMKSGLTEAVAYTETETQTQFGTSVQYKTSLIYTTVSVAEITYWDTSLLVSRSTTTATTTVTRTRTQFWANVTTVTVTVP